MTVRTWVGRFCVGDNGVAEEGPWLTSLVRQRPDEEADELYVLVEPIGEGGAEYTSQLVDVIAQLYQRDPLSLTGALTRSLRAAHEHLLEWNRKSLAEHRVGAGSSCLALRGAEAYVAQVGPSLAYVRTAAGEVRRFHAEPNAFEDSLGVAEEFEPRLRRIALAAGDLLIIASSELDAVVPRDHVERILARDPDDILPEFYLLCRDRPNFALVLLSCFEQEPEHPPGFLTRAGDPSDEEGAATAAAEPEIDVHVAAATLAEAPAVERAEPALASVAASDASDLWAPPPRPTHERVREITQANAPPPAAGVRLRGEGAKPTYKRTTGMVPVPQLRIPRLAIFAVLALLIVGIMAYVYLPGSVKESREEKFATLVAAAREANARAQATSDGGLRRQLLTDARGKLADAAQIHKDNPDVLQLQTDVANALGVLDAIYEAKDFTPVVDLAQQVTGSLSVTRAVVGDGQAFFLDAKGKRVIAVPVAGGAAPRTILEEGGMGGFVAASRPVQIAWSDQTHSLLIVDDRRQVFAYFPAADNTLPIIVRGADGIGTVDAVASSGGNLYVLDVKQNQVWRYLPGQGGFDSERTALLDTADLRNAIELAVGEDVYVLDSKQGVRRFVAKTEAAFPLAGIDTPMMSPASIAVLPGSNRIVVADRGNKRIIVASSRGEFLKQIVSPSFTDLRAVSVDEGSKVMYVLNGDTLLKAPFPP
jgi:hypothetical protein